MGKPAAEDLIDVRPARQALLLALALAAAIPGPWMRLAEIHLSHPLEALLFGMAIVGAAFLLSWAAEVAQLDVSAGLAIAVLAFIAVLPEYAVDLVFAYRAGTAFETFGAACEPPGAEAASPCSLALANMTGANRLLIGIGWSVVVFIAWHRSRARGRRLDAVTLERSHSIELAFLTVATLYSLTLPLRSAISLLDAAVLGGIFALYTIRISLAPAEEPHLVGPARYIASLTTAVRRAMVVVMFVVAATVILLVAEPFAEALVATGHAHGISEFLLVQWLAPVASETPELLVAALYAWRLNTNAALGTLVSSKVNQWTLLVGSLPVVFAVAAGTLEGLPVEARQREELLLTASQSLFAVAILATLSLTVRESLALFGLFWAQFVVGAIVPPAWHALEMVGVSCVYLALAAYFFVRDRRGMLQILHDGFRTPHATLRRALEADSTSRFSAPEGRGRAERAGSGDPPGSARRGEGRDAPC